MPKDKEETIVSEQQSIPELEALLRTKLGDSLIVDKCTVTNFLPPGENYGSLILKVDAVIRREGKKSASEELHAIAKLPPLTQHQRELFDTPYTFSKESFMYETIQPTYIKFQLDCGLKDEDILDVGPAFYGSRMNLEFGNHFDDNAVILLENLKPRGYYSGNRYNGLDIHHSRITIEAMAKFHALGIAMKSKNKEFFEVLKIRSKCLTLMDPGDWIGATNDMLRSIKEDAVVGKHYESCLKAIESGMEAGDWSAVPEEPWSTIIHGDFWINNILFHCDKKSGLPDDIKFVDFQNYLFLSPLRELAFALGSVTNHEVSENHIPELIDLYHDTLISRLEMMGCDVSAYSRDKFDERLLTDSYFEFSHSIFMLKITTKKVDNTDPESTNVLHAMSGPGSDYFYARMRDLVEGYNKRGWLTRKI